MDNNEINFHLDSVFHEKEEYVKYSFNLYNKIYNLETIFYSDDVSEALFEYCKKKDFFILLALYDEDGRVFLERNIQDTLYWSLPGGSIRNGEDIHMSVNRIANNLIKNSGTDKISLGEIEPVSFIQNTFKYKNDIITHHGLAFTARVRNKKNIKIDETVGSFVKLNEEEISRINRYANKEVAKLCFKKFKNFSTPFPENEISVNEAQRWRYNVHEKIVKRFILNSRLKRKKEFINLIVKLCDNPKSIIDVSCGDSNLIFKLFDKIKPNFAVANDISWSQLDSLIKNDNRKILFTNHNAAYLPYVENSFDVSYCGNTLHHLTSKKELAKVFDSILKTSRKIIIVEIEKPQDTGFIPHVLNKYWYIGFLKDAGGAYLSKADFQSIVSGYFSNKADVVFSEFKNIQGRYMIAEITKKDSNNNVLEVEEKFYLKDIEVLKNKIKNTSFVKFDKIDHEIDTYFSDIDGEFIKNRTCLRFREKEDDMEITYKGKSVSFGNSYAKVEKNIKIDSIQKDNFEELFKSLGYFPYSVVDKKREGWSLSEDNINHNIFIDDVKGCGSFVEIEAIADSKHKDISEVIRENKKIISLFKNEIDLEAKMPYRDFVAEYLYEHKLNGNNINTILFDFDDTLVPTEEIFFDSYNRASIAEFGEYLEFKDYKEGEISRDASLFNVLKDKHKDISVNEDDFMERVYSDYRVSIETLFDKEEVILHLNLIKKLQSRGFKFGIVSSSKREFIEKILGHFGKQDLFDVIVSREDVVKRKPDPEPYNLASDKINQDKSKILVIEDSIKGAVSAQNAGLNCVISKTHSAFSETEINESGFYAFSNLEQILMILLYARK